VVTQSGIKPWEGKSTLPNSVQIILNKIHENGGSAYIVGGCVRDAVLMRNPHDYDVATSLTLDEVMKVFPRAKIVGKAFGVVKLCDVDIATFRIDGAYSDGRHPDKVMFVKDIVQDLSRRDFTINAIAFDGTRYVDPFNGIDAIRRGVIQTVNSPYVRFKEDPLRMLRAFRFSSILGFNIANSTYKAIRELRTEIRKVSKERIREELVRMLSGEYILGTLFSISASGMLYEILPDLRPCKGFKQNKYHKYDVLEHTFKVVEATPKEKPLLRMASLLHDIGKPPTCADYGKPNASFHNHEFAGADMSDTVLKDLRFSTDEIEYITTMVRCHMFKYSKDMRNSAIRRLVRRVGIKRIPDLMQIKYADRVGNGLKDYVAFNEDTELKKRVTEIERDKHALRVADLVIDGYDLKKIGVEEGPFMGKLLKTCLDYVLEDPAKNTKQDLIKLVETLIEEYNKDAVGELQERSV